MREIKLRIFKNTIYYVILLLVSFTISYLIAMFLTLEWNLFLFDIEIRWLILTGTVSLFNICLPFEPGRRRL